MSLRRLATPRKRLPPPGKPRASIRRARSQWSSWLRYIADAGDGVRLTPIADELVRRFPSREDGRYYQAAAAFLAGRATDVESPIRALLTANPHHAKGQNLLGVVCGSLGKHECAQAAFAAALKLNPRDPSVYVNLGYLRLARGDQQAAAEFFAEALAIDATTEAARRGLAELRGPF